MTFGFMGIGFMELAMSVILILPILLLLAGLVVFAIVVGLGSWRMALLMAGIVLLLAVATICGLFLLRSTSRSAPLTASFSGETYQKARVPTASEHVRPLSSPPAASKSAAKPIPAEAEADLPFGQDTAETEVPKEDTAKTKQPDIVPRLSDEERARRPAWVESRAGLTEEGYQMVVTAGPYTTDIECQRAMPDRIREAVADYATLYLGLRAKELPVLPDGFLGADTDLVTETHRETITTSVGPMRQWHARLTLRRKFDRWLDEQVRAAIVERRIAAIAGISSIVVLGMAVAWGILRRGPSRSPRGPPGPVDIQNRNAP